jgi:Na+/H+ antiporter NhaD/arsenite permease-like protein
MALFVVINVMEHARVLDMIGIGLAWVIQAGGDVGGTAAILIASAAFSSVTDNIPLAAMLAKILSSLGTASDSPLWWSVIFGANLGGNITPIGSASTLVAVTIIHKHKLPLSFAGFVKSALPFALVQIVLATIYVLVFLR